MACPRSCPGNGWRVVDCGEPRRRSFAREPGSRSGISSLRPSSAEARLSHDALSLLADRPAEQAAQAPRMMRRRRSLSNVWAGRALHFALARRQAACTWVALLCLPATALSLAPDNALAHAIIVTAQPAMNSVVAPGEIAIRLDFNSRVDSRALRPRPAAAGRKRSGGRARAGQPAGRARRQRPGQSKRALEAALAGSLARRSHHAWRGGFLGT